MLNIFSDVLLSTCISSWRNKCLLKSIFQFHSWIFKDLYRWCLCPLLNDLQIFSPILWVGFSFHWSQPFKNSNVLNFDIQYFLLSFDDFYSFPKHEHLLCSLWNHDFFTEKLMKYLEINVLKTTWIDFIPIVLVLSIIRTELWVGPVCVSGNYFSHIFIKRKQFNICTPIHIRKICKL
jgi:hypothetical protein